MIQVAKSRPLSLRQLAGVDPEPAILQDSTLVVVDAQLEYVSGRLPLDGIAAALDEVAELLAWARSAGSPVVHVMHGGVHGGGGLFDPDGPTFRQAPQAKARPGERVIVKPRPNAFSGTDLDFALRALGRRDLVLVGFMTHNCVSSTARAALDLGYHVTVVASATATRDLPDPTGGGRVPAAEANRATLAALGDRTAVVVRDVAALAAWAG